jgi:hypothetical protein
MEGICAVDYKTCRKKILLIVYFRRTESIHRRSEKDDIGFDILAFLDLGDYIFVLGTLALSL